MKAFVVGAAGFVGKYLINHLRNDRGWSVVASKLPTEELDSEGISIHNLDILDKDAIKDVLSAIQPDYIFHLAAQSSVALSWKNPGLTIDVNVKGSINMLDAVRELDLKSRILLIGSGEEYGHVLSDEIPIREDNALRPGNIYAVTKACQNMIGKLYADAYAMDIMMVRAFNHIGPGQASHFVVSDFCKQVAEIEAQKRKPIIFVGNLSAKRDFTDVRDVVRAYSMLADRGKTGNIYNVGSGKVYSIDEVLQIVLRKSLNLVAIQVDATKFRPIDIPIIQADNNKINHTTGWKPEISLNHTIIDMLNFWRAIVI